VINKFKHGILNIHPSLLPKYRGASPIISAILNGDEKTGYSIILTDTTCDTGKIVAQEQVAILENDDHNTLKEKIMNLAIKNLPEIIKEFLAGKITPYPQNEKFATLTSKIKKTDGLILASDNARTAFNKIRAFSDWPKAYFEIDNKRIIVHSAKIENSKLLINEIQLAGKNKVKFSEFRNGYSDLLTKMPDFVNI
jgi:methionyl-tRNA formyltransferase